jgi:hypothetical protein
VPVRRQELPFTLVACLALTACGKGDSDMTRVNDVTPQEASELPAAAAPNVVNIAPDGAAEPSLEEDPGAYRAPTPVIDGTARVYPLANNVWIFPEPNPARQWIGFLWFGASVTLREPRPARGAGCDGAWYAIEPRGYVCVDDERATLDPEHPLVRKLAAVAPNLVSPWPHRYGESIDLRRYPELPSPRLQRMKEWYYSLHQERVERARIGELPSELAGVDLTPANELTPELLPPPGQAWKGGYDRLRARSTVAWSRETQYEGRAFLLADDLWWMPKDRVITYPTVTFHGVHLGRDAELPLAFFRGEDRPKYLRTADGFTASADHFTRLSWVELTGERVALGADLYLETKQPGVYVRAADAVVPEPRATTPWGTPLDAAIDERAPQRGHRTWIEASILGGWLLAYEGQKPVFATLISAGRGGPARRGADAILSAATPTGTFKINGKFATATMVSVSEAIHSAVPWAQNFSGPYAIHAAYWHNAWGELKSGGCINVSPIDARWLFYEFSEPRIPENWHGVRWLPSLEAATTLIVRR